MFVKLTDAVGTLHPYVQLIDIGESAFFTYVVEGAISTGRGLEDAGDVEQRLLSDANFPEWLPQRILIAPSRRLIAISLSFQSSFCSQ